jgi:hypothetical protein
LARENITGRVSIRQRVSEKISISLSPGLQPDVVFSFQNSRLMEKKKTLEWVDLLFSMEKSLWSVKTI